ncbi:MAG: hypothetical protein MJZ65_04320 [Paludibacteraceae bacterium]|nr:hypothetical protein [Paludibacteraceae bacterium]
MRTIQEIKDQLFLVSVKKRMLNDIQERSKISIELCSEKHAPRYTQLCQYLNCTERQANLLAKMPIIRLADTAEEIAHEENELIKELNALE